MYYIGSATFNYYHAACLIQYRLSAKSHTTLPSIAGTLFGYLQLIREVTASLTLSKHSNNKLTLTCI